MKNNDPGTVKVIIYSDVPPRPEQLKRFGDFVLRRYGFEAVPVWEKSAKFGGGFCLRVGEDVYDWSASGRLKQFRDKLKSSLVGGGKIFQRLFHPFAQTVTLFRAHTPHHALYGEPIERVLKDVGDIAFDGSFLELGKECRERHGAQIIVDDPAVVERCGEQISVHRLVREDIEFGDGDVAHAREVVVEIFFAERAQSVYERVERVPDAVIRILHPLEQAVSLLGGIVLERLERKHPAHREHRLGVFEDGRNYRVGMFGGAGANPPARRFAFI